jgi:polyhydroxyalkanoate synthesis regulator phasin
MKKKLLLIGGSTALLLVCILFGAFFAGPILALARGTQNTVSATTTPTTNPYCQQYLQDLANRLNVPLATLEQDSLAAKEDVLAQLVKDGKLTQAQADTIKQRLGATQTCGLPGTAQVKLNILHQMLQKYQSVLISQLAPGLKLSANTLQSDLQNGQTLVQIARTQNISASQLQTIVLNAAQKTLNQAQQAGDITQQQASAFMQYLQAHPGVVNTLLNHKFPRQHK